jgi:hypothetical protein
MLEQPGHPPRSHEVAGVERGELGGLVGRESEPGKTLAASVVHGVMELLDGVVTGGDRVREGREQRPAHPVRGVMVTGCRSQGRSVGGRSANLA